MNNKIKEKFQTIDFVKLGEMMRDIFLDQEKYIAKKVITEFPAEDGSFFADYFTKIVMEKRAGKNPIFYNIGGPFDIISHGETQIARVDDGKDIVYNEDFTEEIGIRTGVLAPLAAKELGFDFENKKVLIVGSGRLAKSGVEAFGQFFPKTKEIFYSNNSAANKGFENYFQDKNYKILYAGNIEKLDFKNYDYIAFYTNTKESLLKNKEDVKGGAFVASHISSTEHTEWSDSVYKDGNVALTVTLEEETPKDISKALENNFLDKEKSFLSFKDIFAGKKEFQKRSCSKGEEEKKYTLFRIAGSPLHDVALLKYIIEKE